MKFLNTILREILFFLEFKDIVRSSLAFVNKQFFNNIVEDTELLCRLIDRMVPLVKDYDRQEQYYASVTSKILRLKQKHESGNEEFKDPEMQFQRMKDYSTKELVLFILETEKLNIKTELVCTQRVTGGVMRAPIRCLRAFLNCNSIYHSEKVELHKNGVLCMTGIPIESLREDTEKARNLLQKVVEIQDSIGYKIPSKIQQQRNYKEIEGKEASFIEALNKENLSTDSRTSFKYWYLNRMIYSLPEIPSKTQSSIIQFDTSVHQELMKDRLFFWKGLQVMKTRNASCPIKALAVFTHDYPIKVEEHPLVHIVKDLYKKSTEEKVKKVYKSIFDCESDGEEVEVSFDSEAFVEDLRSKAILAGLIPDMITSDNNYMEFSQRFYSSKFERPDQDSQMDNEPLVKAISGIDSSKEYIEMLDRLKSKNDFFRLRLATIAYDLDTHGYEYRFTMNEVKTGRFITVLALEKEIRSSNVEVGISVGGVLFNGGFVPSMVRIIE
ncbi:unnamed protein product [Moneuplotes crassus]|uniref:Uncharacterized protein n=1 Tax=Euplotes crassus TaxID=5936 RepID=A0AAD1U1E9_EUPCR|nr:unnamed protein product [Moneuplotes crassus]